MKYNYYIYNDGNICGEFQSFDKAIPTLKHIINSKNVTFCGIVKAKNKELAKQRVLSVNYDKNSKYYIVSKFGDNSGVCSDSESYDKAIEQLNENLVKYGGNHVTFMGIIKATKKEILFDKIKDLN